MTEALRHPTDPLADGLGHATDAFGDEFVDRVDLLGEGCDHGLEVVIDRLTSMLEFGRARLQTAVEAFAGDAHDPLDDTVERARLGSRPVAGDEDTGTDADCSDGDEGDQERDHEHGFHARKVRRVCDSAANRRTQIVSERS